MDDALSGRGLTAGVISYHPREDGLMIRMDDENRPEFWAQLTISIPRLEALLAACRQKRTEAESEVLLAPGPPPETSPPT